MFSILVEASYYLILGYLKSKDFLEKMWDSNKEQTYETPVKNLWPKSILAFCIETWYTDIQIIFKQSRAFPQPCPQWCDSPYRCFILFLYVMNVPRLATLQRVGWALKTQTNIVWNWARQYCLGWKRCLISMCACDSIGQWYTMTLCATPEFPSVVLEGMGQTSGSCLFSYPHPQCIC